MKSEQVFCKYWLALQVVVQVAHTVLSKAEVAWQAETWYCVSVQDVHEAQVRSEVPPHEPVKYEPAGHEEVQLVQTGFEVALQVPDRNVPEPQSEACVQGRQTRSLVAVQGEAW